MAPSCRCARYGRVRSLVLRFDLSALPYLLCLIPGPSPSVSPRSVVPGQPRPCRLGKSNEQRSDISPVEKGGRSRTVSSPWSGLSVEDWPVIMYLGWTGRCALSLRHLLGYVFTGKRVHLGPRVHKPDSFILSVCVINIFCFFLLFFFIYVCPCCQ